MWIRGRKWNARQGMDRSLTLFVRMWQVEKALNVAGDDILYVGDHSAPHAVLPSVMQDASAPHGCQSRSVVLI